MGVYRTALVPVLTVVTHMVGGGGELFTLENSNLSPRAYYVVKDSGQPLLFAPWRVRRYFISGRLNTVPTGGIVTR